MLCLVLSSSAQTQFIICKLDVPCCAPAFFTDSNVVLKIAAMHPIKKSYPQCYQNQKMFTLYPNVEDEGKGALNQINKKRTPCLITYSI